MTHLNAGELIDVAEGTRSEASVPHVGACVECRRRLADLRAMMSTLAEVDVPEPSPLFWDHLSERVRTAVSEDVPRRSWLDAATWRRLLMPLSAVAVASLIVAVVLDSRVVTPHAGTPSDRERVAERPPPPAPAVSDAGATIELSSDPASDDDVSLMLVASLTADLDLDGAGAAGLAPHGSAEHAVTHMNDDELRELRRLLKEQLASSGA